MTSPKGRHENWGQSGSIGRTECTQIKTTESLTELRQHICREGRGNWWGYGENEWKMRAFGPCWTRQWLLDNLFIHNTLKFHEKSISMRSKSTQSYFATDCGVFVEELCQYPTIEFHGPPSQIWQRRLQRIHNGPELNFSMSMAFFI